MWESIQTEQLSASRQVRLRHVHVSDMLCPYIYGHRRQAAVCSKIVQFVCRDRHRLLNDFCTAHICDETFKSICDDLWLMSHSAHICHDLSGTHMWWAIQDVYGMTHSVHICNDMFSTCIAEPFSTYIHVYTCSHSTRVYIHTYIYVMTCAGQYVVSYSAHICHGMYTIRQKTAVWVTSGFTHLYSGCCALLFYAPIQRVLCVLVLVQDNGAQNLSWSVAAYWGYS